MLLIDVIKISSRSFKNNRLRTFLTVTGIGIGIAAIFFLVSLGYGFQKLILEKIATADSLLSLDVTQKSDAFKLTPESILALKQLEGVEQVLPVISQESQASANNFTSDVELNIVEASFFSLEAISLLNGEFFQDNQQETAVVSSATLELLSVKPEEFKGVGLTVKIAENSAAAAEQTVFKVVERRYKIVGVIEDDFNPVVYLPSSSVQDLKFASFSKVKVKVKSDRQLEKVREQLISQGYFVSAISDMVEQTKQIFRVAQVILALFGAVALVVSAIGMFNTMTIALLERTQEIGIMKALGASRLDIWKMFLTEAIIMGFLGGFFGVIIGYGASRALNGLINFLAKNFGGGQMELFYIPVWFVVFILCFSTAVGLITGFYPAKRAARLKALDALRYK